jgi:hypothetical protein
MARSRHIMAFLRKAWLNLAGCYVLYWYLEFEAKRLCGEAGMRGADGDDGPSPHHPATRGTAHDVIGRRIVSYASPSG